MEKYSCENEMLIIDDPELGIHIKKPWTVPRMPEHPKNGEALSEGAKVSIHNYFDGSRRIAGERAKRFHGEWRITYPSQKNKIIAFYSEGNLHGPFRYYSEEGVLLVENWFVDGKKEGRGRSFYLEGQKSSEERFQDNLMHGLQQYWFPDGTLKTSMTYNKGVIQGKVELYYPNGKLFRALEF